MCRRVHGIVTNLIGRFQQGGCIGEHALVLGCVDGLFSFCCVVVHVVVLAVSKGRRRHALEGNAGIHGRGSVATVEIMVFQASWEGEMPTKGVYGWSPV